MDDYRILFYLVVGGIWVLSRMLKKKQEPPQPGQTGLPDVPARPGKGLTFEELLREISTQKEEVPSKPTSTFKEWAEVDSKDEFKDLEVTDKDEEDDLEAETLKRKPAPVVFDANYKDNTVLAYDRGKLEAFNRKSLEEIMSETKPTEITYGRFREFEKEVEDNTLQTYMKELKDPDGFKKAVVLSEVLGRRF